MSANKKNAIVAVITLVVVALIGGVVGWVLGVKSVKNTYEDLPNFENYGYKNCVTLTDKSDPYCNINKLFK